MTSAEVVDCKDLGPGSIVEVETMSRHYQIECLGGTAIRISGHPKYCPDPVEGTLEVGVIERGMRLSFQIENHRPITTSRVISIQVDEPEINRTIQ
jgi:hypothetical protein